MNLVFSWINSLPDNQQSELSLRSKPYPSGTPAELKQTLRSDMQILLCDSCLFLSSIVEKTVICYLGTQYGDSSTEVTELSFFFNFWKRKKEKHVDV